MQSFFFFSGFLTDKPTKGAGRKKLFFYLNHYSTVILIFLSSTPCGLWWYIFLHYLYWYSILTHGLTLFCELWWHHSPWTSPGDGGVPLLLCVTRQGTIYFAAALLFFEKWLLFIQSDTFSPHHCFLTLFLTPTTMYCVPLWFFLFYWWRKNKNSSTEYQNLQCSMICKKKKCVIKCLKECTAPCLCALRWLSFPPVFRSDLASLCCS